MSNLFIFVSRNFVVYDRTAGRNNRMELNKKYRVVQGSVSISVSPAGTIKLKRFSQGDVLEYDKEIVEPGMYVVTPVFVQALPTTKKEERILYNRLRDNLENMPFMIHHAEGLSAPYTLNLHVQQDKMLFKSVLQVHINPEKLSVVDIDEILDIVGELNKINIRLAIYLGYKSIDIRNGQGHIFPLDINFLRKAAEDIKNSR